MRRLLLLVALLLGCSRGEQGVSEAAISPAPAPFAAETPAPAVGAEPTAGSARERRAQCLTYTVEREESGESRRVRVRVRNACDFSVPVEESSFEITAMPSSGQGIAGHATGRFQTAIGPHSSNVETFIEVDCPGDVRGGCKYYVEPH